MLLRNVTSYKEPRSIFVLQKTILFIVVAEKTPNLALLCSAGRLIIDDTFDEATAQQE
jgi:hypothetical protein